MLYFEDFQPGRVMQSQLQMITIDELASFVALTGECHDLHCTPGVVPASFVQAKAAGALIAAVGQIAVVGLRRSSWRSVAPVLAGRRWYVESQANKVTSVNSEVGIVDLQRMIIAENGTMLARADLNLAVSCRPLLHHDQNIPCEPYHAVAKQSLPTLLRSSVEFNMAPVKKAETKPMNLAQPLPGRY